MILLQNISEGDLKFIDDINECLTHNMSNFQIEKIVIFSNVKDIETKIGIDRNSKRVILIKIDPNHLDIIKYGKKNSKDYIIYSTPFIKFNDISSMMGKVFMDSIAKEPYSYYIFRRDVEVSNGKTIDEILLGSKIKSDLNIQRFGYYSVPNFPIKSIGWDITRNYKEYGILKKGVDAPVEKALTPEKIHVAEKFKRPKRVGSRKIDVVIVSVNYNDFLLISLDKNSKIFENITVVTSSSDFLCQKICKKFGINCVVTEVMYEDAALFNKGKAINEGIKSISNPDYILLLDADIIIVDKIDVYSLKEDVLYTSDRYMIFDYDSYQGYLSGDINKNDFILEENRGFGFFQLFNYAMNVDYSELSKDASADDLVFRDKFSLLNQIDNTILHLGLSEFNWKGRKTKSFISYEIFNNLFEKKIDFTYSNWKGRESSQFLDEETMSILLYDSEFDVNEYFDKIYCLNLDRREDRWDRAKREFNRFGLRVDRFSAIDGQELAYDNTISIEKSSDLGLIENSGALGCLISHRDIIKDARSKGYKKILVFEDDIVISEDFNRRISLLSKMDWELFYLGASQFDWGQIRIEDGYYRCNKTLGTFAYAIDCSVYDTIIESSEGSMMSIDNILSLIQGKIGKKALTFFPNIVISDVSDSDIRADKKMIDYSALMRWEIDRFNSLKESSFDRLKRLGHIKVCGSSDTKTKGRKILFLINVYDIGGAEYVAYHHIKACHELGYEVTVLSVGEGMFFEKTKKLGVNLYQSNLDKLDYDTVHEILSEISKGIDIVYNCNYFGINNYINRIKDDRGFEYYTIAHSNIECIVEEVYRHDSITDRYLVIHDKIRDELNKKGVCNSRIYTIPNYVDFENIIQRHYIYDREEVRKKLGFSKKDFVIGMTTRISLDKNILDSLRVLQKLGKEVKLLIIGDAPNVKEAIPYKNQVVDEIKDRGLSDRVKITGHVDNDRIFEYLSCIDVSLNTSPSEGLPISLLEQMSCGIHCIYPSHGEIPAVLNGYGSVINIRQRMDIDGIFKRFEEFEIDMYVDEIKRVIEKGTLNKEVISDRIRYDRSCEVIKPYLDFIFGGPKDGISFMIRARDEIRNIEDCIRSISDIADEIIYVDHLSKDGTYERALELSRIYPNLKIFRYERDIPKTGKNYRMNIAEVGNSISQYYNFCLTKATKKCVFKWDADFVANRKNLIEMIDFNELRNREDKFSLWFTGETVFSIGEKKYVNVESYYDEFRGFSVINGIKWVDEERCEQVDMSYVGSSLQIIIEKPCFYEIKRVELDEFEHKDGLIDIRDKSDFDIIGSLRKGSVPEVLREIEFLNESVVITYGTFDTFHYGHLEILRKAKELGQFLIVGISTERFNAIKGKKSVFSFERRKRFIESIKYVDLVIEEDTWDQKYFDVRKYNADIFVMGDDWKGKFDDLPCKVVYLTRTEGISTTEIKKIL